jgi:hypothetical protein
MPYTMPLTILVITLSKNEPPINLLMSLEFYMFRLLDIMIINVCCAVSDSSANTNYTC